MSPDLTYEGDTKV